jgi:hypothetical protein
MPSFAALPSAPSVRLEGTATAVTRAATAAAASCPVVGFNKTFIDFVMQIFQAWITASYTAEYAYRSSYLS